MRISPPSANLLLLGAASVVALATAELSLRLFFPQPLDAAYVWPDGTLRHLPSFRFTYTRGDFSNAVRYNALGLRGRDVPAVKEPGATRLAFLGDSFVEGKQVGEHEVVTAALERLAAETGRRLEVVNAGVGGYGTGDELLLWERCVAALRPDLVLVGFFPNDVRNNVDRAFFDVRDGRVVQVAEPPRPRVRWLYEAQKILVSRSHLAYLVKSAALGLQGEAPDRPARTAGGSPVPLLEDEDVFAVGPSPLVTRGWTLTLALLGELRRRVEAQGARFAVVVFPNRYQVDDGLWAEHTRRLGLEPEAFDLRAPHRRLAAWSAETGATVVDVLEEFRQLNRANSFYYLQDAHWNAAGHRRAAEALLRELDARGLLTPASGGS